MMFGFLVITLEVACAEGAGRGRKRHFQGFLGTETMACWTIVPLG